MGTATDTALGTHSEVGKLRTVMVHRPDLAHERLSPSNCHELLFDDVIWVRRARQEFDAFADLMRERGVEIAGLCSSTSPCVASRFRIRSSGQALAMSIPGQTRRPATPEPVRDVAGPAGSPPPDAGAPMGAPDDRPSMLGRRFRMTLAIGAVAGLVLALVIQLLLSQVFISRDTNGWTWFLTAIGGLAVGGALTLFLYGVSTDRTDTGPKPRGRADVSTEGEDRKSRRRRRRHSVEPR